MALPRISRGLATPSARTTTVATDDAETDGDDDETREVPIPVPPDVSEEAVQEAADAAAEALPEDTEAVVGESDPEPEPSPEPDEMQRTIEQLRSSGDPNKVERTPVLESGNIEVAPDEWELGFPLQGIPRLAAVLNLNYVYNESRERWERQEPFRDTATGAPVAKLGGVSSFSVSSGGTLSVSYQNTLIEDGLGVDRFQNGITVPSDGTYYVETSLRLDSYGSDARAAIAAAVPFGNEVRADKILNTDSNGNDGQTITASAVLKLQDGDKVQTEITNNSSFGFTVTGGDAKSFLSVHQL